jgi:hypothetical protein
MDHQIIRHHCVFVPYNTKKSWKALLQGTIPTPPVMPKANIRSTPLKVIKKLPFEKN